MDDLDDDLAVLAERCADADPGIRRVAMMALAESIEPEAEALLVAGLADADSAVREATPRGLMLNPNVLSGSCFEIVRIEPC